MDQKIRAKTNPSLGTFINIIIGPTVGGFSSVTSPLAETSPIWSNRGPRLKIKIFIFDIYIKKVTYSLPIGFLRPVILSFDLGMWTKMKTTRIIGMCHWIATKAGHIAYRTFSTTLYHVSKTSTELSDENRTTSSKKLLVQQDHLMNLHGNLLLS